jgi:hypothetical protein
MAQATVARSAAILAALLQNRETPVLEGVAMLFVETIRFACQDARGMLSACVWDEFHLLRWLDFANGATPFSVKRPSERQIHIALRAKICPGAPANGKKHRPQIWASIDVAPGQGGVASEAFMTVGCYDPDAHRAWRYGWSTVVEFHRARGIPATDLATYVCAAVAVGDIVWEEQCGDGGEPGRARV